MSKIVVYVFIIVLLSGCSIKQQEVKTEEANVSYGMEVSAGMDKYSLTMSSVPGLPIEIIPHGNSDISDLRVLATCNDGQFLSWADSGEINELGDELILPFEEKTIYWTPNFENENDGEYTRMIVIGTYNKDLGIYSIVYRGTLEEDEEGFYSIDFDVNTR